jgi:hypothetical protein
MNMYCKYGHAEAVKADVTALNEIQSRQGTSLLIDVIAEQVGTMALKYKLDDVEIKRLKAALVTELSEALNERT